MDTVEKVYTPTTITDTPFPQSDNGIPAGNDTSGATVHTAQTIKDQPLPKKKTAHELISAVLNTRSKKILGEFEMTEASGFRAGKYQAGVSGEVAITGGGIAAKNLAGETTFALDADTGDAVFKGEIRGGSIDIGDNFTVDEDGNVIAKSIALAATNNSSVASGTNQVFTSGTEADVTSSSITFMLERDTIVLILVTGNGYVFQGSGSGDWGGNGLLRLIVDGSEPANRSRAIVAGGKTGTDTGGAVSLTPMSIHHLAVLAAGQHTIKLTGAADQLTGTTHFNLYGYKMSYVTLGVSL